MNRSLKNRAPISQMEDDQRKAAFAHMHGGGGGGWGGGGGSSGYSSGGSGNQVARVTSPSPSSKTTGDSIRDQWEKREAERRAQQSGWENIAEDIRDFFGGFNDPLSVEDYSTLAAAMPGIGIAVPAGGKVVGAAGKLSPAMSNMLKSVLTALASGGAAYGIDKYRDLNPTIDPRVDHYLALGEDAAKTIAALAGISAAKRGIAKIPGIDKVGNFFGSVGDKMKALQDAALNKLPGAVRTPLSWLGKAYDTVAGFTGSEIKAIPEALSAPSRLRYAKDLAERSAQYSSREAQALGEVDSFKIIGAASRDNPTKAAKYLAEVPLREAEAKALGEKAAKLATKSTQEKSKALMDLARAGYVVGGIAAIEGVEQGRKENYRKAMEKNFSEGKPYILEPDADLTDTSLKKAAMFTVGTLGNPVEKQTRDYVGGKWTKDLAERAYQEYQYDRIETARKAGTISDATADRMQIERAKEKPFNMSGKALYSFTPAVAGFTKFAATQMGKAVKYQDASEISKLYNPQHLAGVGLMTYGNTVGSKLPSSIPVAWNAALAAQGVSQASKQGPKNSRGKVYWPLKVE
jgi:hypothetical protein